MLKFPSSSTLTLSAALLASAPEIARSESKTSVDHVSNSVSMLVDALNENAGVCYLKGLHGPNSLRIVGNLNNLSGPQAPIRRINVPDDKTLPAGLEQTVANWGFLVFDAINLERHSDGSIGWTNYRGVFDPDFDAQVENQFGFDSPSQANDFYTDAIEEALTVCAGTLQA